MPVQRRGLITRDMLQAERDKVFVFGDNLMRQGLGGQARHMRGEPNALGIPTKIRPGMAPQDFFADRDEEKRAVHAALYDILRVLGEGGIVVIPEAGVGTGLAKLPERSPIIHALIVSFIRTAEMKFGVIA